MEGGPNIQEPDNSLLDNTTEGGSGCLYSVWDPRGKFHRLIALVFMCFLGFGK